MKKERRERKGGKRELTFLFLLSFFSFQAASTRSVPRRLASRDHLGAGLDEDLVFFSEAVFMLGNQTQALARREERRVPTTR